MSSGTAAADDKPHPLPREERVPLAEPGRDQPQRLAQLGGVLSAEEMAQLTALLQKRSPPRRRSARSATMSG